MKYERRVLFSLILAALLPEETAAAVAVRLNTDEKMKNMEAFLRSRNFNVTKQEILNECSRIIE